MVKCSQFCTPCCDFCIYAIHETHEDEILGGTILGMPIHCEKHPDNKHDMICEACGYCNDFHCYKVPKEKRQVERRHIDFRKNKLKK